LCPELPKYEQPNIPAPLFFPELPKYEQPNFTAPLFPPDKIPTFNFPSNPGGTSTLFPGFKKFTAGQAFIGTEGRDLVRGVDWKTSWPDLGGTVLGLGGNDDIFGDSGNDFLDGGAGDDLLGGAGGNDVIFGGEGNDTINGGRGTNSLYGNEGNDLIHGVLNPDLIRGGRGDDLLRGYEGNDSLAGDWGQDFLIGDAGADRFILQADTAVAQTDPNQADEIVDFKIEDGDKIFIVASFSKDALSYRTIDNYDGRVALPPEYANNGFTWESGSVKASTAIVAPNGDMLGVLFGVADVVKIQSSITIVSTISEAI
jgi:Ca2+-binding RTX toxin-like protein